MRNDNVTVEPTFSGASSANAKSPGLLRAHEIVERRALIQDPLNATPHLSLSQSLLNQGRFKEALEHAEISRLFLHDRKHANEMLASARAEDKTTPSMAQEDPGLIDFPDSIEPHKERSLRHIRTGRLAAALEHGRSLVTFLPGAESTQIYLNAVCKTVQTLQGDDNQLIDFLKHELDVSKALNISPQEQHLPAFIRQISNAGARETLKIVKKTDIQNHHTPQIP